MNLLNYTVCHKFLYAVVTMPVARLGCLVKKLGRWEGWVRKRLAGGIGKKKGQWEEWMRKRVGGRSG